MNPLRVLLITTALVATACSGSGSDSETASTDAPSASAETTPEAEPASEPDVDPAVDETVGEVVQEVDETPAEVSVVIDTTIDGSSQPGTGTFEVTTGADEFGCTTGTAVELLGPAGNTTDFTCTGGTRDSTFTILWQVERGLEGPGEFNGPWTMTSATGGFDGLTGEGVWSKLGDDGPTTLGSYRGDIGASTTAPPVTTD